MGITRQAYYKQQVVQAQRNKHEQCILDFVIAERMVQPRLGTRKLKHLMSLQDMFIDRDHLFSLLASRRLLVVCKRAYHKTTQSHHRFHCHPNLIKDGFIPKKPEELWGIMLMTTCELIQLSARSVWHYAVEKHIVN